MKTSSKNHNWEIIILVPKMYSFIHLKSLQVAVVSQNNH